MSYFILLRAKIWTAYISKGTPPAARPRDFNKRARQAHARYVRMRTRTRVHASAVPLKLKSVTMSEERSEKRNRVPMKLGYWKIRGVR